MTFIVNCARGGGIDTLLRSGQLSRGKAKMPTLMLFSHGLLLYPESDQNSKRTGRPS